MIEQSPQQSTLIYNEEDPFAAASKTDCGELWQRSQSTNFDFDAIVDKVDNRLRNEEYTFASLMEKKYLLQRMVKPQEFKQLSSSINLGLIYYDPHFDFQPGVCDHESYTMKILSQANQ